MLSSEDCNVRRNACYSLSCLVSSKQGQEKILQLPIAFKLLENVACLITSNDTEATQFAVAYAIPTCSYALICCVHSMCYVLGLFTHL